MSVLPPPTEPFTPDSVAWANYFLALSQIELAAAPLDARYWTGSANGDLTNDQNLGLLATGFLFLTVAAGIATPSTSATIAASVLTGALPALDGAALTNLTGANIAGGGTYTPTLTGVTNVAAFTAYVCQYLRVGAFVSVSGLVDVDPTGAGATELGISLPVVSGLALAEQCAGTAVSPAVAGLSAAILADAPNDRASMQWTAVDTANRTFAFQFLYRVL